MTMGMIRQPFAVALLSMLFWVAGCASPVKSPVVERSSGLAASAPAVGAGSAGSAATTPEFHQVAPGETLNAIARRYGVSPETLAQLNGLSDPHRIFVGQQLRLRPATGGGAGTGGVQVFPVGTPGGVAATAAPPAADGTSASSGVTTGGRLTTPPLPASGSAAAQQAGAASAGEEKQSVEAPPATGGWMWPANGPILASFDGKSRKGVDIGGQVGDPVVATLDGTVSYVGEGIEGFGLIVILQHPDDYVSVYAHNDKVVVKEGEKVKRGQVIARLGRSGNVDRPKLHFQIRRAGKALDPESLLPKR